MKSSFILILNCGSSSIKFTIFDIVKKTSYLSGIVDAINSAETSINYRFANDTVNRTIPHRDFTQALAEIVNLIEKQPEITSAIIGIGHRVVHGGEYFTESVIITPEVIANIRACIPLAPLHNPANLTGIEQAQHAFPQVPHVAVFDTAFHQSMKPHAYLYALPYRLYRDERIRRYGFHGTSHRYISRQAAALLNKSPKQINLISVHLGNGCSLAAIAKGKSVDTTMGLTPLEGLIMGSRCGNIDPSIPTLLMRQHQLTADTIDNILNRESGLLGISELSNDMRTLRAHAEKGHKQAQLAIQMFCYQLAKQIAALWVAIAQVDALVFTGGIGENSPTIRKNVLFQLAFLGFDIDDELNHQPKKNGCITTAQSRTALVIKTDEEAMIAEDTACLIGVLR